MVTTAPNTIEWPTPAEYDPLAVVRSSVPFFEWPDVPASRMETGA